MASSHGTQHLLIASSVIAFAPESVQMAAFTTEQFTNSSNATPAPTTEKPAPRIVEIVLLVLLALVMAANGATLIAVLRMRSVRPKIKLLSGSLSTSHTLLGLTLILPRVIDFDSQSARSPACILRYAVLFLSTYTTCCTILAVAVDRTVALAYHNLYSTLVTFKRTALVMLSLWVWSALATAATLAGGFPRGHVCELWFGAKGKARMITWHGVRLYGSLTLTCVVLVTALYLSLGARLRKQGRQVRALRGTARPVSLQRLERNTTVTVFSLTISFIIGYLPFSAWALAAGWQEEVSNRPADALILIFPFLSCLLDPVIYFWRLHRPVAPWSNSWRRRCRGTVVPVPSIAGAMAVPADQQLG